MNLRGVTFDAAGTLIAPSPSVGTVYAEVATAHGLERSAVALDAAFGPAFRATQQQWDVPYGADDEDARRFWIEVITATFAEPLPYELTMDLYDTYAEARRWRVLPGAREALAWCRAQGLRTAVVSNFDCRLPPLLQALSLSCDVVITSTMVGRAKPDPAPLRAAAERMQVELTELLHVGDSLSEDGGMCAALGVPFVHVSGRIPDMTTLSQFFSSQSTLPQSTLPQSTLPQSTLPQSTLPQSTLPQSTLPQSTLPQSTLPQSTLPQSTLPPSTSSQSKSS